MRNVSLLPTKGRLEGSEQSLQLIEIVNKCDYLNSILRPGSAELRKIELIKPTPILPVGQHPGIHSKLFSFPVVLVL